MRSEELFDRAQRVIPGGVNSPVRAFRGVGGTPRFVARAEGARLTDVDGRTYIDYVMSWGPLIAGHAHPAVLDAARAALVRGSSYGAPTEAEVALADAVVDAVPAAEMIRLVSSGTEAGMSVVRLARGATGRTKILKFAGHYHGHSDGLLVDAGSGVATLGIPGSPGVTVGAAQDTIVVGWNDREGVEAAFTRHGDDIAVIICEPVAANIGVVPPDPGFIELLREITTAHGALLCFDEVITGFRLARGGAQEHFGINPDLVMLGKVLGGGFPLAAFAGRGDVMERLAPVGDVYQAGTLSGNPVAVAAGLATLELLTPEAYQRLQTLAERLATGLEKALASSGVPGVVQRVGTLCSLYFSDAAVRDYADARAADHAGYARLFHALLDAGHYLPPSGFEALFLSLAHTSDDIDATVAAAANALSQL